MSTSRGIRVPNLVEEPQRHPTFYSSFFVLILGNPLSLLSFGVPLSLCLSDQGLIDIYDWNLGRDILRIRGKELDPSLSDLLPRDLKLHVYLSGPRTTLRHTHLGLSVKSGRGSTPTTTTTYLVCVNLRDLSIRKSLRWFQCIERERSVFVGTTPPLPLRFQSLLRWFFISTHEEKINSTVSHF